MKSQTDGTEEGGEEMQYKQPSGTGNISHDIVKNNENSDVTTEESDDSSEDECTECVQLFGDARNPVTPTSQTTDKVGVKASSRRYMYEGMDLRSQSFEKESSGVGHSVEQHIDLENESKPADQSVNERGGDSHNEKSTEIRLNTSESNVDDQNNTMQESATEINSEHVSPTILEHQEVTKPVPVPRRRNRNETDSTVLRRSARERKPVEKFDEYLMYQAVNQQVDPKLTALEELVNSGALSRMDTLTAHKILSALIN